MIGKQFWCVCGFTDVYFNQSLCITLKKNIAIMKHKTVNACNIGAVSWQTKGNIIMFYTLI